VLVWLRSVAVHVCVVHVGQLLFIVRRTEVIGHTGRVDGGYKRGRQGGLDGGGGGDGGVV